MISDLERYLFDLQGFLILNHVLSSEEIAAINAVLDHPINHTFTHQDTFLRLDGLLRLGEPFLSLMDHPSIAPYLSELLGENYRLDHDYAHILRQGCGPIEGFLIHGGGTPYDPGQYYHFRNDRFYNGLTAVAFNLTDVHAEEGGFGCIPGSHKSNLPLPPELAYLDLPHPCLQAIPVSAGSVTIFTEALTHGPLPWIGKGDRRTLFYKYSPFPSAWYRNYYNPDDFPTLTPQQRRLLNKPGVAP